MDKAIQILLNPEKLNLPDSSAVYAVFSSSKCRFVGVTDNLHQTILEHFMPNEPNIPFRYFMQSVKPKIIQYEVLPNTLSFTQREAIRENWNNLFTPTDGQASFSPREVQPQLVTI